MADTNWNEDVQKYVPDADDTAIEGVVRHCGIALQSRDASLVSFTNKSELERVREKFLKKKLGLSMSDEELDGAIASIGDRMKAVRNEDRVTVYYMLADHFGKLSDFA
jgi:hypothetical protein